MRPGSDIAAAAFADVAAAFDEAVQVVPLLAASEYAEAAPDNTRAVVLTRGVVALSPAVESLEGVRRGSELQGTTRINVRTARVWFTPVAYAGLGYPLREGDRIVLTERGSAAYRVARDPIPSDRGDVTVTLTIETGV